MAKRKTYDNSHVKSRVKHVSALLGLWNSTDDSEDEIHVAGCDDTKRVVGLMSSDSVRSESCKLNLHHHPEVFPNLTSLQRKHMSSSSCHKLSAPSCEATQCYPSKCVSAASTDQSASRMSYTCMGPAEDELPVMKSRPKLAANTKIDKSASNMKSVDQLKGHVGTEVVLTSAVQMPNSLDSSRANIGRYSLWQKNTKESQRDKQLGAEQVGTFKGSNLPSLSSIFVDKQKVLLDEQLQSRIKIERQKGGTKSNFVEDNDSSSANTSDSEYMLSPEKQLFKNWLNRGTPPAKRQPIGQCSSKSRNRMNPHKTAPSRRIHKTVNTKYKSSSSSFSSDSESILSPSKSSPSTSTLGKRLKVNSTKVCKGDRDRFGLNENTSHEIPVHRTDSKQIRNKSGKSTRLYHKQVTSKRRMGLGSHQRSKRARVSGSLQIELYQSSDNEGPTPLSEHNTALVAPRETASVKISTCTSRNNHADDRVIKHTIIELFGSSSDEDNFNITEKKEIPPCTGISCNKTILEVSGSKKNVHVPDICYQQVSVANTNDLLDNADVFTESANQASPDNISVHILDNNYSVFKKGGAVQETFTSNGSDFLDARQSGERRNVSEQSSPKINSNCLSRDLKVASPQQTGSVRTCTHKDDTRKTHSSASCQIDIGDKYHQSARTSKACVDLGRQNLSGILPASHLAPSNSSMGKTDAKCPSEHVTSDAHVLSVNLDVKRTCRISSNHRYSKTQTGLFKHVPDQPAGVDHSPSGCRVNTACRFNNKQPTSWQRLHVAAARSTGVSNQESPPSRSYGYDSLEQTQGNLVIDHESIQSPPKFHQDSEPVIGSCTAPKHVGTLHKSNTRSVGDTFKCTKYSADNHDSKIHVSPKSDGDEGTNFHQQQTLSTGAAESGLRSVRVGTTTSGLDACSNPRNHSQLGPAYNPNRQQVVDLCQDVPRAVRAEVSSRIQLQVDMPVVDLTQQSGSLHLNTQLDLCIDDLIPKLSSKSGHGGGSHQMLDASSEHNRRLDDATGSERRHAHRHRSKERHKRTKEKGYKHEHRSLGQAASPGVLRLVQQLEDDEAMAKRLQEVFDAEEAQRLIQQVPDILPPNQEYSGLTPLFGNTMNAGYQLNHTAHTSYQQGAGHQELTWRNDLSDMPSVNAAMMMQVDRLLGDGVQPHMGDIVRLPVRRQTNRGRGRYTGRYSGRGRRRGNHMEELSEDGSEFENLWNLAEAIGPAVSKGLPESSLNLLPTFVYTSRSNESEENECSICMDDYEAGDHMRRLPCFHFYHAACIDKWLQDNRVCPVCREEVNFEPLNFI